MKKLLFFILVIIVAAAVGAYYAFPDKVADFLISYARHNASLDKKIVQVDNHQIVYLESPRGKETILLLHGYSANKYNWLLFSSYLKDYHLVIPDLPGYGESSKLGNENYGVDTQIERLHKFCQRIKINKFHIVGNSMGGWFAGAYAVRFPEEVLSIGFFNAAGVKSPRMSEVMKIMATGANPLLLKNENDYSRLMSLIFLDPPFTPYPIQKMFVSEALANRKFYEKTISEIIPDIFSLEKNLPKIKAPALIIWGAQDRIIDVSSVSVFERGLKKSQTLIIDNCGHAPMLEKPHQAATAYLAFIKSIKN